MHSNDQLFPVRQTRRDFLKLTGAATAAWAVGVPDLSSAASNKTEPVRIGSGFHTYEAVPEPSRNTPRRISSWFGRP